MKDRLKYVIDSRYFNGTCLTSMSDGFHNDYGGETIEELRIRENNPYLKAVTPSDIDKKLRLYNQSLSEPFKSIFCLRFALNLIVISSASPSR